MHIITEVPETNLIINLRNTVAVRATVILSDETECWKLPKKLTRKMQAAETHFLRAFGA